MWKKEDMLEPTAAQRPEVASGGIERTPPRTASGERATIGRSITINGEVTGDEDLLIQGRVDGSVNLKQHSVTVGPEGEVKANISGRMVIVDGRVEGNITADEQVILRSAARVEGDITAPRVVLEDGARFRGGVDMGEPLDRSRATGTQSQSSATESRRSSVIESVKSGSSTEEKEKPVAAGMKGGAPSSASAVPR